METTEKFESKIKSVLAHLQNHKTITSWEAITLYGSTRLAAVIFILKERGHSIETEMVFEKNTRYAIYHYAGLNQLEGLQKGN